MVSPLVWSILIWRTIEEGAGASVTMSNSVKFTQKCTI